MVDGADVVTVLGALRRLVESEPPVGLTVHIEHNAGTIVGGTESAARPSVWRRRGWRR